jgi:DNA-binding NtrC family response regulator
MTPPVDAEVDTATDPSQRHILVVDDEASVRRSIAKMLRLEGYDVACVESAEQALVAIAQAPVNFDLVVSDVMMTGMSGVTFAECVRSLGVGMRVMLISGFPGSYFDDGLFGAGGFDLLEKPFTPKQLVDRVRASLSAPQP